MTEVVTEETNTNMTKNSMVVVVVDVDAAVVADSAASSVAADVAADVVAIFAVYSVDVVDGVAPSNY